MKKENKKQAIEVISKGVKKNSFNEECCFGAHARNRT